jgi:hypothetical protein
MKSSRFPPLGYFLAMIGMLATPLAAESYTATIVQIVLDRCGAPPTLVVIPNEDEELPSEFEAERLGKSFTWQVDTHQPFNAEGRVASVRFEGGRTGCDKSLRVPLEDSTYPWLAQFRFKCDPLEPLWRSLTIDNNAAVPMSTVRDLAPCKEKSLQSKAPSQLTSVAWEKEKIYVHFGSPGKLLFDSYDMEIKNGKFAGTPIDGKLTVKRADLIRDLDRRGGRGGANAGTIQNGNLHRKIVTVTLRNVQ